MKLFTKKVSCCDKCPAILYKHSDGEGESCPYSYYRAVCREKRDSDGLHTALPHELIEPESWEKTHESGYVPKRKIPEWCPLKDEA